MFDPLELKICRACLATDVKLFNLHKTGLLDIFIDLTRNFVEYTESLPQYVCYYCRTQLLKFTTFRENCQRAAVFFQDLHIHHQEIPGESTKSICNLKISQFSIALSQTNNLLIEIPQDTLHIDQIDETKIYSHFKKVVDTDNFNDDINNYDDFDDRIKINQEFNENVKVVEESKCTIEMEVKNEIDNDDVIAEPLTELKTEIEKKNTKQKHSKKYKKKDKKLEKLVKKKKCNRYNEKFEEDFEEFSKQHNMKVVCLSKEEQIRRIEERKESKEYMESRFSCDVCYKGFMSMTAHKRHMKAHDPSSGAHICEICKMRYPTQRRMIAHARSHKKIFVCTLCEQVNVNTSRAKLHSRWHKGVKFECTICNKEYNAHTTYLSHVRELHKPVECPRCGDTFTGTNQLNKHDNSVHRQCECSTCGVVFQNTKSLERHKDDRCDGKAVPCVLCGANFTHRADLSEHMKQTHNDGEIFTCEQCAAVFPSDRALGMHFANAHYSIRSLKRSSADRQTRQTQFLCEWCAKSFPTALRLKLHHQLHTGDTPYECSVCQKRLKTKAGLEFHINSHTGQRPYKCRLCSETFKSHAHRHNHHLMKHTQRERRHACPSCEKCFMSASELKKHVRFVHLKLPRHTYRKVDKNNIINHV